MNTTSLSLGPIDEHRRERLLNLADLLSSSSTGAASLEWPNINNTLVAENRRDYTAGYSVPGRLELFENQIRPHSAIVRAGATTITLPILQDSRLPSIDRSEKAVWSGTAGNVAPTLDLTHSSPKRLSAYLTASTQLMNLSPALAGAFLEKQLLSAIGAAIDDAALNGVGPDQPVGLLADPNVAQHTFTTSITAADVLAMEQAIAELHGESAFAEMGWLGDPATRRGLRSTARSAGITSPVWTDGADGGPLGYKGTASPWAPSSTLIFGNMPDLIILQSSSVEVLTNPYSRDIEGFVRMTINGYFDIVALNPARSFIRAVAD